jgi:hypothetical protein
MTTPEFAGLANGNKRSLDVHRLACESHCYKRLISVVLVSEYCLLNGTTARHSSYRKSLEVSRMSILSDVSIGE